MHASCMPFESHACWCTTQRDAEMHTGSLSVLRVAGAKSYAPGHHPPSAPPYFHERDAHLAPLEAAWARASRVGVRARARRGSRGRAPGARGGPRARGARDRKKNERERPPAGRAGGAVLLLNLKRSRTVLYVAALSSWLSGFKRNADFAPFRKFGQPA